MNKQELIAIVAERARQERPVTKTDVAVILSCLGDALLEDVLLKGEKASLPRVGRFESKQAKGGRQFWVFDFSAEAEGIARREQAEVAK